MKRLLASVTVSVVAVSVLAACGGDPENAADEPTESTSESPSESTSPSEKPPAAADAEGAGTRYCDLLTNEFSTLFANAQTADDVTKALAVIDDIAAEAPDEVSAEWQTMAGALGEMKGPLTEAAKLQEQMKSGKLTQEQLQKKTEKLMASMQALDTKKTQEASTAVAAHVGEYCGVKLGQ